MKGIINKADKQKTSDKKTFFGVRSETNIWFWLILIKPLREYTESGDLSSILYIEVVFAHNLYSGHSATLAKVVLLGLQRKSNLV